MLKKMKLFLIITALVSILGVPMVKAETAVATTHPSNAMIWLSPDGVNDMPNGRTRWAENILQVDGRMVYCIDYARHFQEGNKLDKHDALEFLMADGHSRDEAQAKLTELALYKKFFENRHDLSLEQRYFFGQALIWTKLADYYNWEAKMFYVEAWQKNNMSLFQCKTPGDACIEQNTEYENSIYTDAVNYYNNNKNKFKGKGVVWDNGQDQPLIELETQRIGYDYSLDMACTNCNSKNADSKAIVIQDTTNWDAILNSESSDCDNVKKYYHKGGGTFCREEYHVYFPNQNNKITVQLGRYFTLNAEEEQKKDNPALIPNFQPVKVTKIRQCKGGNLQDFDEKSKNSFINCTGDVNVKYSEKNYKYSGKLGKYKNYDNYSSGIVGDTLNQSVTYSYTLKDNVFRYIKIADGKSIINANADQINSNKFYDLKVSNFPISFDNNDENIAYVQFSYELPDNRCDQYSTIKEAYKKENNYLNCSNNENIENVYKKYRDNKASENENINDSACAKLYGNLTSSEASKCINARQGNKMGKCFSNNQIGNNKEDNYSCLLKDECKTEEDAKTLERSWNPDKNKCCPPGLKYDKITKECFPDGPPDIPDNNPCKTKEDADRLGLSWNQEEKVCCPIGKKYDKITKSCDLKTTCSSGKGVCPDNTCGTIVDGQVVCSCLFGSCNTPTLNNVVYRTIDLKNPFVGKSGDPRVTGVNWGFFNDKTGKLDNSSNNNTVVKVITNDKKQDKVYNEDNYLYKITLDSNSINKIRNYNSRHKYDDFELKCLDNGDACISDFLNNTDNFKNIKGKCVKDSKTNFYSCAG